MAKRQHTDTVHFNVQYINYLFYIQVWEISVIRRSVTSFSLWSATNQHYGMYSLCRLWILHLYSTFDFLGFYGKSSRLFHSLWSWQAGRWKRRGLSPWGTTSPSASTTWLSQKQSELGSNLLRYSSGRLTNKKSVINSLDMAAAYITFECSFISLDIRITSTQKIK